MAAVNYKSNYNYSVRAIWGIAKSPELLLDKENLYSLIARETGKEHIKDLTQGEINSVCRVLSNMKDSVKTDAKAKRTDVGGDPRTIPMRRKIYALTSELGWNNDNSRINAFVKSQIGVERIEWINLEQCNDIIEALKDMVKRRKKAVKENALRV